MELEARENQIRNTDFKYKKFYQKEQPSNIIDIKEMKDYLKEVKEQLAKHYDHLAAQKKTSDVKNDEL